MTAPMVDYKIHWLKMMSVPESRAVVGRHDGINGRDNSNSAALASRRVENRVRCTSSVLRYPKKLSIGPLSRQFPLP